jgi:hypothetical protein
MVCGEQPGGVLPVQQPNKHAVGARDDDRIDVSAFHARDQSGEIFPGSHRAHPEVHGVLHPRMGGRIALVDRSDTHHDPLLVDHDAARVGDAADDVAYEFVDATGRHVAIGGFTREARGPFVGEVERQLVNLPTGVVVHVVEAETFEAPRGSRAHVSLEVVAIDDHRPVPVETSRRLDGALGAARCAPPGRAPIRTHAPATPRPAARHSR